MQVNREGANQGVETVRDQAPGAFAPQPQEGSDCRRR
jgi:hypothetical protein